MFRKPLIGLTSGAARGRLLQRLKAGPVEIEWEKLDQAEQDAATATDSGGASAGDSARLTDPDLQAVLEFASKAPEAAVVRTSKSVEYELYSAIRRSGIDPRRNSMIEMINAATAENVISVQLADSLHVLRRIRNQVVHGQEEVTPARAAQYVLTAGDVIDNLKAIAPNG